MSLDRLQHQIGGEEERKQEQVIDKYVDQQVYHAALIASFGQVPAHAPQSTHLSGSIA